MPDYSPYIKSAGRGKVLLQALQKYIGSPAVAAMRPIARHPWTALGAGGAALASPFAYKAIQQTGSPIQFRDVTAPTGPPGPIAIPPGQGKELSPDDLYKIKLLDSQRNQIGDLQRAAGRPEAVQPSDVFGTQMEMDQALKGYQNESKPKPEVPPAVGEIPKSEEPGLLQSAGNFISNNAVPLGIGGLGALGLYGLYRHLSSNDDEERHAPMSYGGGGGSGANYNIKFGHYKEAISAGNIYRSFKNQVGVLGRQFGDAGLSFFTRKIPTGHNVFRGDYHNLTNTLHMEPGFKRVFAPVRTAQTIGILGAGTAYGAAKGYNASRAGQINPEISAPSADAATSGGSLAANRIGSTKPSDVVQQSQAAPEQPAKTEGVGGPSTPAPKDSISDLVQSTKDTYLPYLTSAWDTAQNAASKGWDWAKNNPQYSIPGGIGALALAYWLSQRNKEKEKEKAASVKKALGIGTMLGAGIGGATAPQGYGIQGLSRGGLKGLGVDIGGTGGAGLGALLAMLATHGESPGAALAGSVAGAGIGGYGGYSLADRMLGKAPWDKEEEEAPVGAKVAEYQPDFFTRDRLHS